MAAYQDASELEGKTLTLVNSGPFPAKWLTTWTVINVRRSTNNSPSVALKSRGGTMSHVLWPKLREWIQEGYIDVT